MKNKENMDMTIFNGIGSMSVQWVVVMLVVFMAMMVDLASGLRKAKERGEIRTSQALKRTLTKFITYEGGISIAFGIDVLIHMSQVIQLIGLDVLYNVTIITDIIGVFLLAVEFISVREKADQKTKKQMIDTAGVLAALLQNDSIKDMIRAAMEQQNQKKEEE